MIFNDVFHSLAAVCDLPKSLVFSGAHTILPFLTAGLNYSIGYSGAFSTIYGWNGRALSKNLVRFERFVEFIVRFLDSF